MPGFVAKTSVVTAILHWTYHGITGENVIDCRVAAGYTPNGSLVNTLNTAIIGTFAVGAFDTVLAGTTVYTGVGLRDMRTEGGAEILSTNGTHTMAGTGVAPPNQVAICISKRTAMAGKFFRGRLYLGGLAGSILIPTGLIDDAVAVIVQNWASALGSALVTNSLTPAIHSPAYPARPSHGPSGGELPAHPESLTDITTWIVRDRRYDTQRRRLQ